MATEDSVAVSGTNQALRTIRQQPGAIAVQTEVVADFHEIGDVPADQVGANGVLTFTFAATYHLIWVCAVGGTAKADPYGGTPTASKGIPCFDSQPMPMEFKTNTVKVYAPSGVTVTAWGSGYA